MLIGCALGKVEGVRKKAGNLLAGPANADKASNAPSKLRRASSPPRKRALLLRSKEANE